MTSCPPRHNCGEGSLRIASVELPHISIQAVPNDRLEGWLKDCKFVYTQCVIA